MDVVIYTNAVAGGWSPLDKMLGGGEECVVELAGALARAGASVTVFGSVPNDMEHVGVSYRPREGFDDGAVPDSLITWKDPGPWILGARARTANVHWSSDVESRWAVSPWLTAIVCLSRYHRRRLIEKWKWKVLGDEFKFDEGASNDRPPELSGKPLLVSPPGVPKEWLHLTPEKEWSERPPVAIYCSSLDRGLMTLLQDWPDIRRYWPEAELRVAYGWRHFDAAAQGNARAQAFKSDVTRYLLQKGITYLGELSSTELKRELLASRWWVHPLNRPDSELFCLSAVKARACGALPVVLHALDSGFADTVDVHVPYQTWLRGKEQLSGEPGPSGSARSWDNLVNAFWLPLLRGSPQIVIPPVVEVMAKERI